jgi:hypothetical protein
MELLLAVQEKKFEASAIMFLSEKKKKCRQVSRVFIIYMIFLPSLHQQKSCSLENCSDGIRRKGKKREKGFSCFMKETQENVSEF